MSGTTTQYSTLNRNDKRIVVGIAELEVSKDPLKAIVTHALGSCIGVTIYDPINKVGGMLHYMLPDSRRDPEKGVEKPAMYGATGIPLLFKKCYELGAQKENLIVCAAGGAEIMEADGHFKVGTRNRTLLRKIFWKNNILVTAEETGGKNSRTMTMHMDDGRVEIRHKGEVTQIWPA